MKIRKLFFVLLSFLLCLSACGKNSETKLDDESVVTEEKVETSEEDGMFSNRDFEMSYDETECVVITLNDTSATSDSSKVEIEGSTIKIKGEGTYFFRGNLQDGMILVDADEGDKVQLVLSGVSVTNSCSAALCILEADKVFVTLAEETENNLSNGGVFEAIDENNIDGAVFSKQDLTFNGVGSLNVESTAEHGIVCKDDLVFTSGTYTITSASHGIDVNDSFRYTEASLTIAAGKDGVHVENEDEEEKNYVYVENGTISISAEGDGISAGAYMQIEGGTFDITAGGGAENGTKASSDSWGDFGGGMPGGGPGQRSSSDVSVTTVSTNSEDDGSDESTSMKGIKADGNLEISGGTFQIDSADDAIHSNASIKITDGNYELATGDDGIHGDDTLEIVSGMIAVTESYEGLEALHIIINGGKIDIVSTDDGFNAAGGTIEIKDGDLYINASGDGIDSNGSLEISGGYVVVCGPTQGDTSILDYNTTAVITGGTFIGTGSISMAQLFSDAEQGVFAVQCSCQGGTEIKLFDKNDSELICYTPELDFTLAFFSSPEIEAGQEYTIQIGDQSGTFEAF